jgi:hypothetical protein
MTCYENICSRVPVQECLDLGQDIICSVLPSLLETVMNVTFRFEAATDPAIWLVKLKLKILIPRKAIS